MSMSINITSTLCFLIGLLTLFFCTRMWCLLSVGYVDSLWYAIIPIWLLFNFRAYHLINRFSAHFTRQLVCSLMFVCKWRLFVSLICEFNSKMCANTYSAAGNGSYPSIHYVYICEVLFEAFEVLFVFFSFFFQLNCRTKHQTILKYFLFRLFWFSFQIFINYFQSNFFSFENVLIDCKLFHYFVCRIYLCCLCNVRNRRAATRSKIASERYGWQSLTEVDDRLAYTIYIPLGLRFPQHCTLNETRQNANMLVHVWNTQRHSSRMKKHTKRTDEKRRGEKKLQRNVCT